MKANAGKHDAAWLALLEQRRAATGRGDVSPVSATAPKLKVKARGRTTRHVNGKMNRTEAAYAAHLDLMLRGGLIARWDFEPEKLRLADRTFYTPDFRVVMPDGMICWHEVKGFLEDDAAAKLKIAAEQHDLYQFFVVRKRGLGHWQLTDVLKEGLRSKP